MTGAATTDRDTSVMTAELAAYQQRYKAAAKARADADKVRGRVGSSYLSMCAVGKLRSTCA